MKRNQFFLTATRLLVKIIFFYVLGVFFGNQMKEESLFLNIDEEVTALNYEEDNDIISIDNKDIVEKITINNNLYTLVKSYEFMAPMMNTFIVSKAVIGYNASMPTVAIARYARAQTVNTTKKPRGDSIPYNTS